MCQTIEVENCLVWDDGLTWNLSLAALIAALIDSSIRLGGVKTMGGSKTGSVMPRLRKALKTTVRSFFMLNCLEPCCL